MSAAMGRPKIENANNIKLSTRINKDLNDRLEEYCKQTGKTKGAVIREGVEKVLGKNEK